MTASSPPARHHGPCKTWHTAPCDQFRTQVQGVAPQTRRYSTQPHGALARQTRVRSGSRIYAVGLKKWMALLVIVSIERAPPQTTTRACPPPRNQPRNPTAFSSVSARGAEGALYDLTRGGRPCGDGHARGGQSRREDARAYRSSLRNKTGLSSSATGDWGRGAARMRATVSIAHAGQSRAVTGGYAPAQLEPR